MNLNLNTVRAELAPGGRIKAGLNLSNSLLNMGQDATGAWQGVAPDLARAIARQLGVDVEFVPYSTPSQVTAAIGKSEWTLAMIAADPARSGAIAFTSPYAQIEAAYMVPPDSPIRSSAEVDQPGCRVAAYKGSAFGLWLERNLRHATLIDGSSFDDAFTRFRAGDAHAMASLVPKLLEDQKVWPGCRVLDGGFMTVRQAIACSASHRESAAFLRDFVEEAKRSSLISRLIRQHNAVGLSAAEIQ